jgi:hypothetical protein
LVEGPRRPHTELADELTLDGLIGEQALDGQGTFGDADATGSNDHDGRHGGGRDGNGGRISGSDTDGHDRQQSRL